MATSYYGRRLSELLQEQQEPFLIHRNVPGATATTRIRKAARTRALLWDLAAGCFSCGSRDSFRRLPVHPGDDDGARQLSPVSVLEPRSDEEESTELTTHSGTRDEEDGALDSKPSTSASSPSSESDPFTFYSRIDCKVEAEDKSKLQTPKREQVMVSTSERIAADISRIPRLVELDLSLSAPEWRRRVGEEEAWKVGHSIEAMIFEEVRWEAVRDMLCSDDFSYGIILAS